MGIITQTRHRLAAAISPNKMMKRISRPRKQEKKQWLVYKEEDDREYEDYKRMLNDPQVKSGYELIRNFLLSRDLIVTPASDDPQDVEIAKTIEDNLNNMKYPLRKVRKDMYTALPYGYSVSEIIYTIKDDLILFDSIRPIDIETIQKDAFEYDEDTGECIEIIQYADSEDIHIPFEKTLVFSHDSEFGNLEGNSIFDAIYNNWFDKQNILQWWNLYLQKHEGPTIAAFIEEGSTFKDDVQDKLDDIAEGAANLTLGANDKLQVIESTHRGEGFINAIKYHDTMIFRKMIIGNLMLGDSDNSGAYSQSNTQSENLDIFLDGVHTDLASEIQLAVDTLVSLNWDAAKTPIISFEKFEEKDLLLLLEKLQPLLDGVIINPEAKWFKTLLSMIIKNYVDIDLSELLEENKDDEKVILENELINNKELLDNMSGLVQDEEGKT